MSRSKISTRRLKKINYNGKLLKNFDLSGLTTFKCGGKCSFYLEINTLENFLSVIFYIAKIKIKYFVLGAGSNVLVSDNGFDGVVIKLGGDFDRIEQLEDNLIECGAGCNLTKVISQTIELGLGGLECGVGIPATIGGAVFMNAGAYDFEMSKVVDYVVAFVDGKIAYFENFDCDFSYRHSVFQKNNAIILRVGLRLEKQVRKLLLQKSKEIMKKRLESQPLNFPSAGCVFKRIDGVVVSKLLDECGLKGLTFGGAKVSEKHANFIINFNHATAQDIYELIGVIKKRFKDKTDIELQTEIKFLGDFDEDTR